MFAAIKENLERDVRGIKARKQDLEQAEAQVVTRTAEHLFKLLPVGSEVLLTHPGGKVEKCKVASYKPATRQGVTLPWLYAMNEHGKSVRRISVPEIESALSIQVVTE